MSAGCLPENCFLTFSPVTKRYSRLSVLFESSIRSCNAPAEILFQLQFQLLTVELLTLSNISYLLTKAVPSKARGMT